MIKQLCASKGIVVIISVDVVETTEFRSSSHTLSNIY